MGCRLSKNDPTGSLIVNGEPVNPSDETNMSSADKRQPTSNGYHQNIDYKARLEKKLCLSKDTPEPDFDVSECALKEIPNGVFILCRVLRKENLNISYNKLRSFKGGGQMDDLALLQSFDIRNNYFTRLPDDFSKLQNLRELLISNNLLEYVPATINQLINLEHLDISYNKIAQINSINCMTHLRILNVSGNSQLTILPNELSTCDSLVDIIFDVDIIRYPPTEILERGTLDILKFLLTNGGDFTEVVVKFGNKSLSAGRDVKQNQNLTQNDVLTKDDKYDKQNMMEQERVALEKTTNLEAALHLKQQKRKQEFLQQLLDQQTESDSLVNKMQQQRDVERLKLINDVLQAEQNSTVVVQKLLSLKNNEPDPILLEQERREQAYILEQLRIQHCDLRKQEVLTAMTEVLSEETKKIVDYREQRNASNRDILLQEHESIRQLNLIFKSNDKDRTDVINEITQNEQLQKTAVASLIAKNDSRTWGLVEQIRIVESQLAALTHYEIERRKLSIDKQLVDESDKRINLTIVLLDLLDQQEKRKKQLLDTILNMENQKQNEQDFWLLQYQKLIDSQPKDLSLKSSTLDPNLGLHFLLNGVVHCLPFLLKILQNKYKLIDEISDADLEEAGIKSTQDRMGILKSIQDYFQPQFKNEKVEEVELAQEAIVEQLPPQTAPLAAQVSQNTTPIIEKYSDQDSSSSSGEKPAECIICMENSCKIIFLPCGHLCSCVNCQINLKLCPMCRTEIERRIKVIQP